MRPVESLPDQSVHSSTVQLAVAGVRLAQIVKRLSIWSGWIGGQGYMTRFSFETPGERQEFLGRIDDLCALAPGEEGLSSVKTDS